MQVKDVMKIHVATVQDAMTFFEVAKIFLEHHISAAPVLDATGKVVGVLSEKDLFRALYPQYRDFYTNPEQFTADRWAMESAKEAKHAPVKSMMSPRLIVATPDTNVLKIGGLMLATGVHQVPVVHDGKLVGMVSRREIYRAILEEYYRPES